MTSPIIQDYLFRKRRRNTSVKTREIELDFIYLANAGVKHKIDCVIL